MFWLNTLSVVHVVQIRRLEVPQLEPKVLEQRPPPGVGLDLRLGPGDADLHEAADRHR